MWELLANEYQIYLLTRTSYVNHIKNIINTFSYLKNKNQLGATYYFIVLFIGSACFGHYYAHHQKLATIMLITTLVVLQIGRSLVRSQLVSLEFFIDVKSFQSHYGPGVDSVSNRNEYQEYFLGVMVAGA